MKKKIKKKHPVGRPLKYDKAFHIDDFIRLSKVGKNLTQIALEWDINRDTIYEWGEKYKEFSDAIKRGRAFSEAWYTNLGQAAMLGEATFEDRKVKVDVGLYVWLTKNLFKWSDRIEEKVTAKETKVVEVKWADEDDPKNASSDETTKTD